MNMRKVRGYAIISKGDEPTLIESNRWLIPSQSNPNRRYQVTRTQKWNCECPDFQRRAKECKHIHAIKFYTVLKNRVELDDLNAEDEFNESSCPSCNSMDVIKRGKRETNAGMRQRYLCKQCGKRFVFEPIKHIKGNAKMVCLAMDLYFKGSSLRDIADTFYKFYGLKLSHETVRRWIRKFTKLMNEYSKTLNPKLGGVWQADEQVIKVGKKKYWDWNIIDEKTRYLVANQVTKTREMENNYWVYRKAAKLAKPDIIKTDKWNGNPRVISDVFGNVKHIASAGFASRSNTNIIERYHNGFREFDKTRRGFKRMVTAQGWNDGYRVFHNFIRRSVTDGLTPSERANIDIDFGRNTWLGLLKLSLQAPNVTKTGDLKKDP